MENSAQNTVSNQTTKPFPILPVFLSVLVFLLLSSTAFLSYHNMQLTKQIVGLSKPITTPTPISDSTANWKSYSNEKIGLTFKYPVTLSVSNIQYYDPQFIQEKTYLFGLELKNNNGQTLNTFTVYSSEIDVIDWIKQNYNKLLPPLSDISSQQQIQINALDVHQIKYAYGAIFVFADDSNRIFVLSAVSPDVGNQILSTFKFTDQASSTTCTPLPNCAYNQDPNGPVCKIGEKSPSGGSWCPRYTCPANGWVDCEPSGTGKPQQCSEEAMAWYKANCPNFQGGAL